jgi:AraC-like DNA-binding protein
MDTEREEAERNQREQRRREMLRALERHLNHPTDGGELARDACMSRFHFQRVFRHTLGEPPGGLRRRLRLERAASDLRQTDKDVTVIALEAEYQSLEGFSRAFKRAYGLSPSMYRRQAQTALNIPGTSGVHYDPTTQRLRSSSRGDRRNMDLVERLLDSDYTSKKRMLENARILTDTQLDAPLAFRHNLTPFEAPERTLREALDRMADFNAFWSCVMFDKAGWAQEPRPYRARGEERDLSIPAMMERLDTFAQDFQGFVRKVRDENQWEQEFIDDLCEPPETFTYADVIEFTITYSTAQRLVVERLLGQMGIGSYLC